MRGPVRSGNRRRIWYWFLLIPYLFLLFPAAYARVDPVLGGFPFFYWYQLAWVVLTALLTTAVYFLSGDHG